MKNDITTVRNFIDYVKCNSTTISEGLSLLVDVAALICVEESPDWTYKTATYFTSNFNQAVIDYKNQTTN